MPKKRITRQIFNTKGKDVGAEGGQIRYAVSKGQQFINQHACMKREDGRKLKLEEAAVECKDREFVMFSTFLFLPSFRGTGVQLKIDGPCYAL